jgi:pyruvate/2-oxoglutarate dehydrogenase complex dihydrolipoamide dehydrogenase (E3) component
LQKIYLYKGLRITVIDMAKHILPGFDEEFAEYVENHLADQGIMTFTETKLEAILGEEKVEKVKTTDGLSKQMPLYFVWESEPILIFLQTQALN